MLNLNYWEYGIGYAGIKSRLAIEHVGMVLITAFCCPIKNEHMTTCNSMTGGKRTLTGVSGFCFEFDSSKPMLNKDMKSTLTWIFLLLLIPFLLSGCLGSSSNPVKSGDSDYGNVAPSNWVKYGSDDSGDVFFYEKGNIERDFQNNIAEVWEKNVLSDTNREFYIQKRIEFKKPVEGWEKLSEIKSLTKVNCARQVYRTASILFCNSHGRVLDYLHFSETETDWKDIQPGSRVEMLEKQICR